jgi:hypothetical protein
MFVILYKTCGMTMLPYSTDSVLLLKHCMCNCIYLPGCVPCGEYSPMEAGLEGACEYL